MNLEEIKERENWCDGGCALDECVCVSADMTEAIKLLIAEVERLKANQVKGVFSRFAKGGNIEVQTATRCAEIARNLPAGYSGEIRNGADVAAKLIEEEYGL